MSEAWFKPKTHGYGAAPANWKGWAAMAVFAVVELALLWGLVIGPLLKNQDVSLIKLVIYLVLTLLLTAGLIWLARVKSDGDWRWRWGNDT